MASSNSSSSSSCLKREATLFKKVQELTILCGVEACLIRYDSNNNLKIWPNDHEKVRKLAKEFTDLPEITRGKRSVNAREILDNLPNKKQKMIYEDESKFNPENYSSQSLEQALVTLDLAIRTEIEAKNMIDSQIRMINYQNQQDLSLISSFGPVFQEILYSDLLRDEEAPNLGFQIDNFPQLSDEQVLNQNLGFQIGNINTNGCFPQLSDEQVRNQNLGFQIGDINTNECFPQLSDEQIRSQNLGFQVNANVDPITEYLQQLNHQGLPPVYQSGPVNNEPQFQLGNFGFENVNNVWYDPGVLGFY